MSRPRRTIVFAVTPEEWDRLCRMALTAMRDPYQQARYLVCQALDDDSGAADADEPEPLEVA